MAATLLAGAAFAENAHPKFRWPVIGRTAPANDGVDIAAPEGSAVHAAADGAVIYASDEIASYGRMIVIRHAEDYVTTYAHLSDMAVTKGVTVRRGQVIGKSGKPALHFELRKSDAQLKLDGFMSPR